MKAERKLYIMSILQAVHKLRHTARPGAHELQSNRDPDIVFNPISLIPIGV